MGKRMVPSMPYEQSHITVRHSCGESSQIFDLKNPKISIFFGFFEISFFVKTDGMEYGVWPLKVKLSFLAIVQRVKLLLAMSPANETTSFLW